jgi:hypothetical protein
MTDHWRAEASAPQPPYPTRRPGPTYRRLLTALEGDPSRTLVRCTVCDQWMARTTSGAHAECLAPRPEPEPYTGPTVDAALMTASPAWEAGIARSALDAASTPAPAATKPDSVTSSLPPVMGPAELAELRAVERKLAQQLRKLPSCAVCRRPMVAEQRHAHAVCRGGPGAAYPGWSLPTSRKRKRSATELAFTTPHDGPMWTDWAAALVACGLADEATIRDQ